MIFMRIPMLGVRKYWVLAGETDHWSIGPLVASILAVCGVKHTGVCAAGNIDFFLHYQGRRRGYRIVLGTGLR
jgi:hypothetical protein